MFYIRVKNPINSVIRTVKGLYPKVTKATHVHEARQYEYSILYPRTYGLEVLKGLRFFSKKNATRINLEKSFTMTRTYFLPSMFSILTGPM